MNREQKHPEKGQFTSNIVLSGSDKPLFHDERFYSAVLANGTNLKVHCTTVVQSNLKAPTNDEAETTINELPNVNHQTILEIGSIKSIPSVHLNTEKSPLENVVEYESTQPMIITNRLASASKNHEPENKLESLSSLARKTSVPSVVDTRSVSADSSQSGTSAQRTAKHKSSRLVIGPTEVLPSDKSLGGAGSEKSLETRRTSLEWSPRVSINTPKRRMSEHEVSWVESNEINESDKSSDTDSGNEVDSRPSIVVNMDTTNGRKRSFALDRLDDEIKQYLEETLEEMDNEAHPSDDSKS